MTTLAITFSGICLLLRDEVGKRLHVLLPQEHHGHHSRLICVDDTGTLQKCEIAGEHIDLTAHVGSGFDLSMPPEVFDFETSPYKRKGSNPIPLGNVRTRVSLASGKHAGATRPGGIWNIDIGSVTPHRFATAVRWEIKGLTLPALTLNLPTGTVTIPERSGVVELFIAHVLQPELDAITTMAIPPHTKCPQDKDPMPHLELYFPLLHPAAVPTGMQLPKFDRALNNAAGVCPPPVQFGRREQDDGAELLLMSGSELTCTVATTRLG